MATVTIIHLLALISPGPDFIVACRNAIQYSVNWIMDCSWV